MKQGVLLVVEDAVCWACPAVLIPFIEKRRLIPHLYRRKKRFKPQPNN